MIIYVVHKPISFVHFMFLLTKRKHSSISVSYILLYEVECCSSFKVNTLIYVQFYCFNVIKHICSYLFAISADSCFWLFYFEVVQMLDWFIRYFIRNYLIFYCGCTIYIIMSYLATLLATFVGEYFLNGNFVRLYNNWKFIALTQSCTSNQRMTIEQY